MYIKKKSKLNTVSIQINNIEIWVYEIWCEFIIKKLHLKLVQSHLTSSSSSSCSHKYETYVFFFHKNSYPSFFVKLPMDFILLSYPFDFIQWLSPYVSIFNSTTHWLNFSCSLKPYIPAVLPFTYHSGSPMCLCKYLQSAISIFPLIDLNFPGPRCIIYCKMLLFFPI